MSADNKINFFSPEFKANPYPIYAYLQATAPVHRVALPEGKVLWFVTGYEDAAAILKDPRFVRSWRDVMSPEQLARMPEESPASRLFFNNMIFMDPPRHGRLRSLVQKAFTPAFIAQMRDRVQEIADRLIDAVESRGEMDLIGDFAFPFPFQVIAQMLGIPAEDGAKLRNWTNSVVRGSFLAKSQMAAMAPDIAAFNAYVEGLCEARRREPGTDLISLLVQAEEAGDKLTQGELSSMIMLLIVAGHETTANLIGNGMLALLQAPDQLARLRDEPALIKGAVEELLRYDASVEMIATLYTGEDVELHGITIPKGEQVMVVLAAANRDPRHIPDADKLDVARPEFKHLAFGQGIHFCLGAPLARMEGQIGIATLLRRLPELRLTVSPEKLLRKPSPNLRGLTSLPVAFSIPQ